MCSDYTEHLVPGRQTHMACLIQSVSPHCPRSVYATLHGVVSHREEMLVEVNAPVLMNEVKK